MAEQKQTPNAMDVEEALSTSEAYIIKNKKTIAGVIIALVVVIGGFLLYNHFVATPKEQKASTMLAKGQEYFAMSQYEVALNGDSIGYKGFVKIADEESGTDAANLANAYAGLCLAQTAKYEEAIPYLEKFSGDDQMVAPAVKGALGNCYAHKGDLEKAASLLVGAADESDSQSLSPIWLQQAGEIYEKLGKNDEALKVYQTIKDKYFNSYNGMNIDKYIERVSK